MRQWTYGNQNPPKPFGGFITKIMNMLNITLLLSLLMGLKGTLGQYKRVRAAFGLYLVHSEWWLHIAWVWIYSSIRITSQMLLQLRLMMFSIAAIATTYTISNRKLCCRLLYCVSDISTSCACFKLVTTASLSQTKRQPKNSHKFFAVNGSRC